MFLFNLFIACNKERRLGLDTAHVGRIVARRPYQNVFSLSPNILICLKHLICRCTKFAIGRQLLASKHCVVEPVIVQIRIRQSNSDRILSFLKADCYQWWSSGVYWERFATTSTMAICINCCINVRGRYTIFGTKHLFLPNIKLCSDDSSSLVLL